MLKLIAITITAATMLLLTACGNNLDEVAAPTHSQDNVQRETLTIESEQANSNGAEVLDEIDLPVWDSEITYLPLPSWSGFDLPGRVMRMMAQVNSARLERIVLGIAELDDVDIDVSFGEHPRWKLDRENPALYMSVSPSGDITGVIYSVWVSDGKYMAEDAIRSIVSFVEIFTDEHLNDEQVMLLDAAMIESIELAPYMAQVELNGYVFAVVQSNQIFTIFWRNLL